MAEVGGLASGKYSWRIESYSKKMDDAKKMIEAEKLYSQVFIVGCCEWRIIIYPNGDDENGTHLSVFLAVADSEILSDGWCRDVTILFTLVNKHDLASKNKETRHTLKAGVAGWGYPQFMSLTELNDAVVIKVDITLHKVVPPVDLEMHASRLGSCCSDLSNNFGAGGRTSYLKETPGLSFGTLSPSKRDILNAKHSLKECLSDLFKLNMRDKLFTALSILSRARSGLSRDQHRSIQTFKTSFDVVVRDFLSFEQRNSDFELRKCTVDQISSALKKHYDAHLSHKQLADALTKKEKYLEEKLKEVNSKKRKLIYEWDTLNNEMEELKSQLSIEEKKLEEAEEEKKKAEKRMSRSTSAWSSLKEHFLNE